MIRGQRSEVIGQRSVDRLPSPACGGRHEVVGAGGEGGPNCVCATGSANVPISRYPESPNLRIPAPRAFTLIELMVVISIIGILSAFSLGAMQLARESARESATEATIAKLNNIIMRKYESYMTRRVPIRIPSNAPPNVAATLRLAALREIMRMEMPERWTDIIDPGTSADPDIPDLNLPVDPQITADDSYGHTYYVELYRPALSRLYAQHYINVKLNGPSVSPDYSPAECLYMIVSLGIPEAMEQFNQSEIGDVDNDKMPEFIDGWGRPIQWLRWAPGFSDYSAIQIADATNNHDPFDTRRVQSEAYQLIPLIYSAGPNGRYGIELDINYHFTEHKDPYDNPAIGTPNSADGSITDYQDNITNHNMEQR